MGGILVIRISNHLPKTNDLSIYPSAYTISLAVLIQQKNYFFFPQYPKMELNREADVNLRVLRAITLICTDINFLVFTEQVNFHHVF